MTFHILGIMDYSGLMDIFIDVHGFSHHIGNGITSQLTFSPSFFRGVG
jgi:hypothetical protein